MLVSSVEQESWLAQMCSWAGPGAVKGLSCRVARGIVAALASAEHPMLLVSSDDVREYVRSRPYLSERIDAATLVAEEIGDGNLNLVLVCRDAQGRGVCLKQSLPYVRLVGDSWPLTQQRTAAEARWYEAVSEVAPNLAALCYGFDQDNHVIALEDLSESSVWRKELLAGDPCSEAAAAMGLLVARMSFSTSWMALGISKARRRAATHLNVELCEITEDLVFTEPLIDHPHNSVGPGLTDAVARLRNDGDLRCGVDMLRARFVEHGEALIHGDLHTGSVMVGRSAAGATAKAIDGEFCCYGPVGFDLGTLFANYLFAEVRAAVLGLAAASRDVGELSRITWDSFVAEMRSLWETSPPRGWSQPFLEQWLEAVGADSVGFAGCEALRRIIGLAKVADIESLPADAYDLAGRATLDIAATWIGLFLSHSVSRPARAGQVVESARNIAAERLDST